MKQIIRLLDFLGKKIGIFQKKVSSRYIESNGESKISPRNFKKIFLTTFATVGLLALMGYLFSDIDVSGGLDSFQKNKAPKFDISSAKSIEDVKGIDFLDGIRPGIEGDIPKNSPFFNGSVSNSLEGLEKREVCFELRGKVERKIKLSPDEFETFKNCLKSDQFNDLTKEQIKAYETLSNPESNLTKAEEELMRRIADGTATEEDKELFEALTSEDPLVRQVAKELINNPNLSPEEKEALKNFIKTGEGRGIVDSLLNGGDAEKELAKEAIKGTLPKEGLKELEEMRAERVGDAGTIEESLQETQNQIESDEKLLKDPNFLNQIKNIEEKLASGVPLTPEEKAVYEFYEKVVSRNKENKKKRDRLIANLREINEKRIASGMNSNDFTHGDDEGGTSRRIIKKKAPKRISPSEYELIQKIKMARLGDSYEDSLLPNTSHASDSKIEAKALSSQAPNILKAYNLPPDLKIPCVSETELLLPKGEESKFICKIEDNIYDPENNNNILVAKGATAICKTGGFSADTKLMNVACDKVRNGNQILDISFILTNSSGRAGVMGGIISTKGIKITAAVLADSANGITQYLADVAKLQQAQLTNGVPNITNRVTGSISQGVSSGFSKLAEMLVQDLEGTPDVYYTPRGHKLYLMPN